MSIAEALSLFFVMLSLALIPSASVALAVTRSVTHGVSSGISVSLGIVLGDLIFILLAVLGLSVIAETMGWLFLTIKYIGASYLIWLGYTLLTSKFKTTISVEKTHQKGNLVTSFLAGFFLTLGDIKAILFYVSLFPIFVNLETLQLADIAAIMLVTIATVGGVKIFYAFSANKIASMSKGYNLESKAKKVAGSFMVGAGCYLIVKA
ncbi:MAG: LysE family translocator [Methylococcales bacterium]|jgi:threonine/homoserine/homoserine lactone efflux protein|nr:LysE family translocator [Methylococcales bacterium]MBT7445512.1 LysE family translocator [Methylococcales bacterium]